jgi:hypothetical protein
VLVKFGQLIANGNYVGAVMLGKQLFDRISRWPKCKEFGNNGAADNAQLSDQLGQLLQMFGQMH